MSQQISDGGGVDGDRSYGWRAVFLHRTDCRSRDVDAVDGKYHFVADLYFVALQMSRNIGPALAAGLLNADQRKPQRTPSLRSNAGA